MKQGEFRTRGCMILWVLSGPTTERGILTWGLCLVTSLCRQSGLLQSLSKTWGLTVADSDLCGNVDTVVC